MTKAGAIPTPLSDPMAELLAARFRALAEPMRITLLDRAIADTGVFALRDRSATGSAARSPT